MLLDIVQRKRKEMEMSNYLLRSLYTQTTDALMKLIHNDLVKHKQVLRKGNIKVVEGEPNSYSLSYKIYFRGYEDNFILHKDHTKAQLQSKLGEYTRVVNDKINSLM
jgi:hypothetical protein